MTVEKWRVDPAQIDATSPATCGCPAIDDLVQSMSNSHVGLARQQWLEVFGMPGAGKTQVAYAFLSFQRIQDV